MKKIAAVTVFFSLFNTSYGMEREESSVASEQKSTQQLSEIKKDLSPPFNNLQELSIIILSHLSKTDIGNANQVNKGWQSVTNSDLVWSKLFLRDFPKIKTAEKPQEISWKQWYQEKEEEWKNKFQKDYPQGDGLPQKESNLSWMQWYDYVDRNYHKFEYDTFNRVPGVKTRVVMYFEGKGIYHIDHLINGFRRAEEFKKLANPLFRD